MHRYSRFPMANLPAFCFPPIDCFVYWVLNEPNRDVLNSFLLPRKCYFRFSDCFSCCSVIVLKSRLSWCTWLDLPRPIAYTIDYCIYYSYAGLHNHFLLCGADFVGCKSLRTVKFGIIWNHISLFAFIFIRTRLDSIISWYMKRKYQSLWLRCV